MRPPPDTSLRVTLLAAAAAMAVMAAGCARGGEGQDPTLPEVVLEVTVRFAGPVDDSSYYFIAFDTTGNWGVDYPVPIAAGPHWGNGWGSGSMTHFLQYNLGRYELYRTSLDPVLRLPGGGITAVGGTPEGSAAGRYALTVETVNYGAVAVSGPGMVQAAGNVSYQNAGVITLETNAAGQVVAGSVTFTPAADGSRPLTVAEQSRLDALNAGGMALTADALEPLGLALTLNPPAAGSQTLTVAPSSADVQARFVPVVGASRTRAHTVNANSSTPSASPPIPGATLTAGDLLPGGRAEVDVEISPAATLIGPPLEFTPPVGGDTLRAVIDLRDLGDAVDNISFNVITTTELIFDTTVTDPDLNTYDGLGPLGNDAVTISAREFRSYANATVPPAQREGPNDVTLRGRASPDRAAAVDILDWQLAVRRLR